MVEQVSTGILKPMFAAFENEKPLPEKPILQVMKVGLTNQNTQNSSQQRYRVAFSDGREYVQAMVTSAIMKNLGKGLLERGQLVRLNNYSLTATHSSGSPKVLVVQSCELVSSVQPIIGNPKPTDERESKESKGNSLQRPQVQQQQQPLQQQHHHQQRDYQQQQRGPVVSQRSNNPPQIMPPQSLQRPQAPQVRPPQQPNIRPLTSQVNDADEGVFPISYLSPYHNKWKIKGFVGSKSEIKRWKNTRGEGKLFNVTLLDNSGEIRATAFNQQVDDFFNVLQEGKLFYISKAKINVAKKQYSSVKNDYEITLESGTQIVPCSDDDPMNMLKFDFVLISDLMKHEKDSTIDIIGIVKSADDLQSITTKATQKLINKRELTVVDQSGYMVKITLWGQQAENFTMNDNSVVVCKNVKVGDYQGRSLSVFSGTTLLYNPDIHEAKELRDWYQTIDENQEFNSFSGMGGGYIAMQEKIENRKTIEQVKSENLGSGEKVDYFSSVAYVIFIKKENNYYPACANAGCNKKVSDENRDDGWYCEKCGRTFSEPNYRYIASISVADYTDSAWFQCFNDAAEIILGISANDLRQLKGDDDSAHDAIFEKAYFKPYIFRCRAKIENYNDISRVRYTVANISPVDYITQSNEMLRNIKILDP
ncbi:hypothetical protein Glove_117g547 [Diversispora epigaea]|uniref:Replication protein A subunit n=1 Tax=Diversispora epigaea TaxID=1348612 RepID=A0A397J4V0_9GLOM|nr:hypothetical protein Glove_117g547 [Diversispora epigaea]